MLLKFSQWVTFEVFHLSSGTRLGESVQFFIYDAIKINLLLVGLIFVIALIRSYIPHQTMKKWMTIRGGAGYFFAALFGAVTPFCSCSSIPIFIAFLKAGAPLGVLFSFLITSPIINEYLVVLMLGFFGWKITAAYVVSGMTIGIVSGMVLARMGLERFLVADFAATMNGAPAADQKFATFRARIAFAWQEAWSILQKIWYWVLIGVAVGAAIHNYVPQSVIDSVISSTGIFSVPLAVLIGVPMYGSCAAIVPIAVALLQKGVPLGTALSFMMAIAALSLPEAIMLRRAMKLQLILTFFGITTLAIIFTGYLFNALQPYLIK
jgi:uncharacterized membrane protein YraQ (UPF0718 family)